MAARLSVCMCGYFNLVVYHTFSSKFYICTSFVKLLFLSEFGFCLMNNIKRIFPFHCRALCRALCRSRLSDCFFSILQDPIGEIERLNKALCGPCNTELINAIARTTKFDKLKTVKDPIASAKNKMFVDGKYAIYRKGMKKKSFDLLLTQQTSNVKTTSYECRCDVITVAFH